MRKIFFWVLSVHLIISIWMIFQRTPAKKKHEPLIVKTIPLSALSIPTTSPPIQQPVQQPITPPIIQQPAPPPVQVQTPKPIPKKQLPAQTVKKKLPEKKPAPKSSSPKIPAHLMKELEKSLSKIEKQDGKRSASTTKSLVVPKKIKGIHLDFVETNLDENKKQYQETLIGYLHNSLNLPDFGMVKLKISLNSQGKITNLQILEVASQKNRQYLETQLPQMTFPSFYFSKETTQSFTLTFFNEL